MYWPYLIMITRNYPYKEKKSIKITNENIKRDTISCSHCGQNNYWCQCDLNKSKNK